MDSASWESHLWRVRKEDSAFVYFILESHEGIATYSTLLHHEGDLHRDIEIRVPEKMTHDFNEVRSQLEHLIDVRTAL